MCVCVRVSLLASFAVTDFFFSRARNFSGIFSFRFNEFKEPTHFNKTTFLKNDLALRKNVTRARLEKISKTHTPRKMESAAASVSSKEEAPQAKHVGIRSGLLLLLAFL